MNFFHLIIFLDFIKKKILKINLAKMHLYKLKINLAKVRLYKFLNNL